MADDECEIEYLDEDEDLIQQYVLSGQKPDDDEKPGQKIEESTTDCEDSDELNATIASLVKKREIETKKKAIKHETDSEYDRTDDQIAEETEEITKKPKKKASKHETDSEYDHADDQIDEENEQITKKPKKMALKHDTDSEYDPTEDQIDEETEEITKKPKKKASKPETDSEYDPADDQIDEENEEITKKPKKKASKPETDSEYDPTEDQIDEENEEITKKPKKKASKPETDSEYDPTEDQIDEENEEIIRKISRKRPQTVNKKHTPAKTNLNLEIPIKDMRVKQVELEISPKTVEYNERKRFKIRIPDFEDPLCLPVRAIKKDEIDVKKLNIWNKVCLEQFKKNDIAQIYNNNNSKVVRSCKTAMFRNVKHLGEIETMAYFRTRTQNEVGERRSESCQSMLPRFREKRELHNFDMVKKYPRKFKHRNEVLLTKEKHNNEDVLVVYKPGDSTSTVMKMVEEERGEDIPPHKVLEEIVLTRMCSPCYQMSWRGLNREQKSELSCKICNRTFLSVYSVLTHLRTHHKDEHVRRFKEHLSRTVAKAVNYHYKCRVCQLNCSSVKQLRKHVVTHKGDEVFKCEVGNHMAS